MKNKHLLASDFDGTIALTSIPSPKGMTVDTAYELAFYEIFGQEGVRLYDEVGRVQSREPGELMNHILSTAAFLRAPLHADEKDLPELTEELVNRKLAHILPEISPEWPIVTPGFKEFQKRMGQLPIEFAVLSSGHDEFIRRFFEVNDFPQPGILITSDTLRKNGVPEKFKPNPYSVDVSVDHFTHLNGSRPLSILYIGDSEEKDGEMARNARVRFGLIDPGIKFDSVIEHHVKEVKFRDFTSLESLLFRDPTLFYGPAGFEGVFLNGRALEGNGRGKER